MNILITGARGMVGTALVNNLKNIRDGKNRTRPNIHIANIYCYDIDNTPEQLDAYCTDCDFVFNLAGVNRPQNNEEFMRGNFGFASTLLDTLKKHNTVMPGLVGHDFGDAIRFAANFVEEDSPEAEKAGVNLNIYWAFAEGFLKEVAPTLTEAEAETLGNSCFALACELSTRFLDDYITGDKYFKIKGPKHNLVRTRCQIALAKDMQKKMDAMNAIVRDCWVRYKGK